MADAAGVALDKVESGRLIAIVVGNEGAGVRQSVRDLAQRHVSVPLARHAESLNVAVAAGIILYEVIRAE